LNPQFDQSGIREGELSLCGCAQKSDVADHRSEGEALCPPSRGHGATRAVHCGVVGGHSRNRRGSLAGDRSEEGNRVGEIDRTVL
jgi:hypothetical protein